MLTHAQKAEQNNIVHVAFVLDRSDSMSWYGHHKKVVPVVDARVRSLKARSEEMKLETRVSVYTFGNDVDCAYYDKDVFRLPSVAGKYNIRGATALIDATWLAIEDLEMTPQKYGVHNFLIFVLTDGEENRSRHSADQLRTKLASLPDNFTLSCLVPNEVGEREATRFGFAAGNIKQWNATSEEGFAKAMQDIDVATTSYMTATASGVGFRGTKTLFSTGVDAVNASTVKANLIPLTSGFQVIHVDGDHHRTKIKEFIEENGLKFVNGKNFYQLMKPEKIQPQKEIAIRGKKGDDKGKIYVGKAARQVLGLPDMEVRVKPEANPLYDVFVQSTSTNRLLVEHTDLLVFTR